MRMKKMERNTGWLMACVCLALATTPAIAADAASPAAKQAVTEQAATMLRYDASKDQVMVQADNAMLSELLKSLARQSGIAVRLDPAADRAVTLHVAGLPVVDAVDRMTSGLNVIKQYREAARNKKGKSLLLSISVLPSGKTDPSAAVDLLSSDDELKLRAWQQARINAHDAGSKKNNLLIDRWRSRLASASADKRKIYEDMLAAAERAEQDRQQRQAEHQAAIDKHHMQRDAMRAKLPQSPGASTGTTQGTGPAYDPDAAARAQAMFPQAKTPAVVEQKN